MPYFGQQKVNATKFWFQTTTIVEGIDSRARLESWDPLSVRVTKRPRFGDPWVENEGISKGRGLSRRMYIAYMRMAAP